MTCEGRRRVLHLPHMSKTIGGDVFEQLAEQSKHTAKTTVSLPGQVVNQALGKSTALTASETTVPEKKDAILPPSQPTTSSQPPGSVIEQQRAQEELEANKLKRHLEKIREEEDYQRAKSNQQVEASKQQAEQEKVEEVKQLEHAQSEQEKSQVLQAGQSGATPVAAIGPMGMKILKNKATHERGTIKD